MVFGLLLTGTLDVLPARPGPPLVAPGWTVEGWPCKETLGLRLGVGVGTLSLFGGDTSPGRRTLLVGVQWSRVLHETDRYRLDYVAAAIPLELAIGSLVESCSSPGGTEARTLYGGGLDPVGLQITASRGRVRPMAGLSGGLRVFTNPFPCPGGTRFNVVLDVRVGIVAPLDGGRTLTGTVSLHHLSNGGLGEHNPGLNQLVFEAAISFAR